jgi:hypothetical protein
MGTKMATGGGGLLVASGRDAACFALRAAVRRLDRVVFPVMGQRITNIRKETGGDIPEPGMPEMPITLCIVSKAAI